MDSVVSALLKKPEERKAFRGAIKNELKDLVFQSAKEEKKLTFWSKFTDKIYNIFNSILGKNLEKIDLKEKTSSAIKDIISNRGDKVEGRKFTEKVLSGRGSVSRGDNRNR